LYESLAVDLAKLPEVRVVPRAPLRSCTRFGIGGDAALLVDVSEEAPLSDTLGRLAQEGVTPCVIGGGSNLIVADKGVDGVVVRYRASQVREDSGAITADAGAELQSLVDFTIERGLAGLHTMTRIPGWVGGAIYGNAGAYGHSLHEFARAVRCFDGSAVRTLDNPACEFDYRESVFKRRKDWIILSVTLDLPSGDPAALRKEAARIREIRDSKFPPEMRCAGSIFKNLLFSQLPPHAAARVPPSEIKGGKVASGWFLEQTGVKGLRRGDIQVAHYHANLVYNDGAGTAADLRAVIAEMKRRVHSEFGLALEEEVQFIGF
jgi:UDP-N-acetylmuramate dehydrogenase